MAISIQGKPPLYFLLVLLPIICILRSRSILRSMAVLRLQADSSSVSPNLPRNQEATDYPNPDVESCPKANSTDPPSSHQGRALTCLPHVFLREIRPPASNSLGALFVCSIDLSLFFFFSHIFNSLTILPP